MKPTVPHNPLDDLIAAALHGELTPEERAQFESRLQTDPNAQAAYLEAKAMHDLLEQTHRNAQPDPDFEQRMVSGVRRKLAHPPHEETAWESLKFLWNGTRAFFTRKRKPLLSSSSSGIPWVGIAVALGIIAVLWGVALGPITAGIKPGAMAQLQAQHSIALAQEVDDLKEKDEAAKNQFLSPSSPVLMGSNSVNAGSAWADAGSAGAKDDNFAPGGRPYFNSGAITMNSTDGLTRAYGITPKSINSFTTPSGGTVNIDRFRQLNKDAQEKASEQNVSDASASSSIASIPSAGAAATPASATTEVAENSPDAPVAFSAPTMAPPPPAQTMAASAAQAPSAAMPPAMPAPALDNSTAQAALAGRAGLLTDKLESQSDLRARSAQAGAQKLPTAAPASADNRKLIRNAQLDLEVKSYQSAFDQVSALTRAAGGYVDTSNSQRGGNGKLQGTVVVKILPETLDAFLLKLRDLGDVQNQSVSTDDVTKDYFDTQARIVNSQKMEEQLQELLKRENGKVSDLLAVERELERVRGQIEQMQGQLKLYDFQVQYATVTMQIAEKDLNQTAAYLLKEQDDFALYATDVEGAFQKARSAADDFKTQVLVANLQHNSGTDVSAELTVMVAPDQIEAFLAQVRSLGRVANFTRQTQRVAKDGGDSSQPADETRTDKDKVQVHVTIKSDDDTRKQVAVLIVAKQVDDALDMAKAAVLASTGAEILGSSLNTTPDGASKAQLSARVPGKEYTTLMDAFRALGRQASLNVQRNDNSGPGATGDDAPVIVSLSLTDQEEPVQTTDLVLITPNVDDLSQQIKRDAVHANVEVKGSNFGNQPNGSHLARLTLLLPMGKYASYVETLKKLGRVESLSVQRNDTNGTAADDAPVEIALIVTDDDPPVQVTQMVLVADDVDTQAQQIKKQAGDAGVQIKSSSFERQPDGSELAQMALRLPLGHYPAFLATLQQSGKTESLSVQREDRPGQAPSDDSAPAEIQLQVHNPAAIVPDNSGLWPTLRDTFAQGFGALFGSVKVIGVIIAFLVPWVITAILFAWIGRRIYVWRRNR